MMIFFPYENKNFMIGKLLILSGKQMAPGNKT